MSRKKEYNQEEIDYKEIYALIDRQKMIKLFLAFVFFLNFTSNLNDDMFAFLNKEMYISQPLSFEDCENHDLVFKLKQTLYDL